MLQDDFKRDRGLVKVLETEISQRVEEEQILRNKTSQMRAFIKT